MLNSDSGTDRISGACDCSLDFPMPRSIGTYQERRESAAVAEMARQNRPKFRVFVCDCDAFECRCDQRSDRYAATLQAVSPSEAARQFAASLPNCVYVVVEDDHGRRSSVAFTRAGDPLLMVLEVQ